MLHQSHNSKCNSVFLLPVLSMKRVYLVEYKKPESGSLSWAASYSFVAILGLCEGHKTSEKDGGGQE